MNPVMKKLIMVKNKLVFGMDRFRRLEEDIKELMDFVSAIENRQAVQAKIRCKYLSDAIGRTISEIFMDPDALGREDFGKRIMKAINMLKEIQNRFPMSDQYLEAKFRVVALTNFCISQFLYSAVEDETFIYGYSTLLADILSGIADPFERNSLLEKVNPGLFLKVLETSGDIYFFAVTKSYLTNEKQYMDWFRSAQKYYTVLLDHLAPERQVLDFKSPGKLYRWFAQTISNYIYYAEIVMSPYEIFGIGKDGLLDADGEIEKFREHIRKLSVIRQNILSAYEKGQIDRNDNPPANMDFVFADLSLEFLESRHYRFVALTAWARDSDESMLPMLQSKTQEMIDKLEKLHSSNNLPVIHSPFGPVLEQLGIDLLAFTDRVKPESLGQIVDRLSNLFSGETQDKFYGLHYALAVAEGKYDTEKAYARFEKLKHTNNLIFNETIPVELGYYTSGVSCGKVSVEEARRELKIIGEELATMQQDEFYAKFSQCVEEFPNFRGDVHFNPYDVWTWFKPMIGEHSWYPFNNAKAYGIGIFD